MNVRYDVAKTAVYDGGSMNWVSDTFRAVLLRLSLYTPNLATDANLSDIPAGARAAISSPLSAKTNVAGVFSCGPFTFPAVATGSACAAIAIYRDSGAAGTSKLFLYIDTATGLPVTPAGVDIVVTPDTGTNKLIKI